MSLSRATADFGVFRFERQTGNENAFHLLQAPDIAPSAGDGRHVGGGKAAPAKIPLRKPCAAENARKRTDTLLPPLGAKRKQNALPVR
ncbi:hypothetical protein AVEN_218047-1 [Araneus ventricosus]|uniref:Uncharacterized protein n=1 Tax=Araneus ventricosus TaxID=182803 RepID=A0A4Y2N5X0_ARAVE|nr:hypothetical protein AVEN_218047-1 [Araneus ventricosus]